MHTFSLAARRETLASSVTWRWPVASSVVSTLGANDELVQLERETARAPGVRTSWRQPGNVERLRAVWDLTACVEPVACCS